MIVDKRSINIHLLGSEGKNLKSDENKSSGQTDS